MEKRNVDLFGDKGYISQTLADLLWEIGIQMISKPHKNMKALMSTRKIRLCLGKGPLSECVNDEFQKHLQPEH